MNAMWDWIIENVPPLRAAADRRASRAAPDISVMQYGSYIVPAESAQGDADLPPPPAPRPPPGVDDPERRAHRVARIAEAMERDSAAPGRRAR